MIRETGRKVVYVRLENPSERLRIAQLTLHKSILSYNLSPLPVKGGKKLNLLGDVLTEARYSCNQTAFVWCNSDVVLTQNPFDVPDPSKVYGFHRREIPSGEICCGVDMYYIPVKHWDEYLSNDVPKLYIGASYVDWWISRAMQKLGAYENLVGYIDHETHPQSRAAGSDANPYYQKNFRAYNAWAKRNGLDPIPSPPYLLPFVGHVWGIRNLFLKVMLKFK